MEKIIMEHGSGGRATGELIQRIFENAFSNDVLSQMEDAAVIPGADLDGDGEVTPSDAQIVLNYYVMNSVISIPTDWADLI